MWREGRMLSRDKSTPPGHYRIFNGNICTKSKDKIWFGDIDFPDDIEELKQLATEEKESIYILREMDARFQNEMKPLFEKAVVVIDSDGSMAYGLENDHLDKVILRWSLSLTG